ncbi:ABC transporter permease subunit [Neoactinobaculum massilliense]|uniref:ABC transporter permease subunit n=1 Tax=Neoactinobaculum massilliense TaxID=2364794 RepID=UPI000F532964|nr:ABC transporter permease subunit [Neoactinobaculum massilliense]
MSTIFRRACAVSLRPLLIFSVASVAVMAIYFAVYQTFEDSSALNAMVAQFPEGFRDALGFGGITSGAGWAHTTFFGLLGLFLIMAFGISRGTALLAADEESGMLELTLAHAVSRGQIFVMRVLALLAMLAALTAVCGLSLALWNTGAGYDMRAGNMWAELCAFFGIGAACGALAFSVGAMTGRRTVAAGAGTGLAVGAFLLNAVSGMNDSWTWAARLSPVAWGYQHKPIEHGWDVGGLLALAVLIVIFFAAGFFAFRRRNIS